MREIIINSSNKNILILTDPNHVESLKSYLASYFITKDGGLMYCERKLKNYILSKNEFIKRQKILKNSDNNSNLYFETLLLHKKGIELCYKYNNYYEGLFDRIATLMKDEEKMPSEVEVQVDLFTQIDSTSFQVDNIIEGGNVWVDSFNNESFINFNEFLIQKNIQSIIFYKFDLDLLRYLETLTCNEDFNVNEIHLLNSINSNEFKSDIIRVKNEYKMFRKIYEDYQLFISTFKINENERKDIKSKSSKNILIDYREMSSKVPYYLYDFGFNIVVGGLEIGDYITSNIVCIERKSITTGDLFESLKGGRLVSQIIKMQKYFEHIIILLEYEDDIDQKNNFFKQKFLYRKMIELKAFSNKIYFFWSYNPRMTSSLLNMLKNKFNDFLDINKCLNINKNESVERIVESKVTINKDSQVSIESFFKQDKKSVNNNIIMDIENQYEDEGESNEKKKIEICVERFIRKVDGINNNNYGLVLKNFKNLKEFVSASKDKLFSIFGINGNKMYYFFINKCNLNK
jgi:ERCC4-type nuclease